MEKRQYKMRKRAADQEHTRQRILEATVELHGSLGPKNTSISGVAERAGVQRLTVYRHFPDEFALFAACSSHWLGQNPPPGFETWAHIADPAGRTEAALGALNAYYRQTGSMLRLIYRDFEEVEALQGPVAGFQAYLDAIRDDLASAWCPKRRKPRLLTAAIAHGLAFSTWSSLSGLELNDSQISRLVLSWIEVTVRA
jgi:AcrR family transcriptional regulator